MTTISAGCTVGIGVLTAPEKDPRTKRNPGAESNIEQDRHPFCHVADDDVLEPARL